MISSLGKQGGRRAQMGNTSPIFVGRLLSVGETVAVPVVVVTSTPGGVKNKGRKKRLIYDDLNVDYEDIAEVKEVLEEIPNAKQRKAKETAAKAAKLLTTSSIDYAEMQKMANWWAKTIDSEIAKDKQLSMRLFEAHIAMIAAQWNEEDEILLLLLH